MNNRANRTQAAGWVVAMLLAAMLAWLLNFPSTVRITLAVTVVIVWVALSVRTPRVALYSLLIWLSCLGLVRRLVSAIGPTPPAFGDPLLLSAALCWCLLATVAFTQGALRERTHLANAVLILTGVLTLSALNPKQGGLEVSLGGLLLVVVPMLAFWVGRTLLDDRGLRVVLSIVAIMALPAGLYGLYQTFASFPSWDIEWVKESGYAALSVAGSVRAFSVFSSASEYAMYVAMGLVIWLSLGYRVLGIPRRLGALGLPLVIAAVALLSLATWFIGSRGIIVLLVGAIWLIFAIRIGMRMHWAIATGVVAVLVLPLAVELVAPGQFSDTTSGDIAAHQVNGLTDPFGEGSTLSIHLEMLRGGIVTAIQNPLGSGLGAVTLAGQKYAGVNAGTETDISNAAVAAGIAGLLSYVYLLVRAVPQVYRTASRRRDGLALAAMGILIVTFPQWLQGAQYAVAPMPWLALGWFDRQSNKPEEKAVSADADGLNEAVTSDAPENLSPALPSTETASTGR